MSHADDLQAVSVDEALIDVTSTVAQMTVVPASVDDDDDGISPDITKELAETMRTQIKAATGCEGTYRTVPDRRP
jgi:DNA repair protein REV1